MKSFHTNENYFHKTTLIEKYDEIYDFACFLADLVCMQSKSHAFMNPLIKINMYFKKNLIFIFVNQQISITQKTQKVVEQQQT
jgi:hypothetical protein